MTAKKLQQTDTQAHAKSVGLRWQRRSCSRQEGGSKKMKMRKRLTLLSILVLTGLLLGGCTGRMYDSSDKKKLEETGRQRLEAYFADHLAGAQIVSVEAVEANREMTLMTLTNYVRGEYREEGASYRYYFDTTNGRLFTSRNYAQFTDCMLKKVRDGLALTDQARLLSSKVEIYLPDMQEMTAPGRGAVSGQMPPADKLFPFSAPCIPIEAAEDPEAYIEDKDRREMICVSLTLAVDAAEGVDLTGYGFDDFYYAPCDNNIYYGYLCIQNALSVTDERIGYGAEPSVVSKEMLTASGGDAPGGSYRICYEVFDDAQQGEDIIHGVVYRKTEILDIETGNISTREEHFDLTG